jgi:hypothetical protein
MIITDWPEGQALSLVRAHALLSLRNCRCCLTPTCEFADTTNGLQYGPRLQRDMQDTATFFKSAITKKLRRGFVGEAVASGKELSIFFFFFFNCFGQPRPYSMGGCDL